LSSTLFQIILSPPIPGFDNFIGTWLYTGGPVMVVDVGPSVTAGQLLDALARLNINHLDFILLSHIHMDHTGAVGEVAAAFPDAPVVCHPKSMAHLADPAKLTTGTIKALGDLGRAYGPIQPTPLERLRPPSCLAHTGIEAVMTPGHAPHHVSYIAGPYLFAGEAGGVCLELPTGGRYMRPATPPKFFMNTFLDSIQALLDAAPRTICYGHLGMFDDAPGLLAAHQDQICRWHDIIRTDNGNLTGTASREAVLLASLLARDPLMAAYKHFPPDQRKREDRFLLNSVAGFLDALTEP
jgi:glyoxylase-like metal-dependent hydrolase (beta-lactamase superfamily II)